MIKCCIEIESCIIMASHDCYRLAQFFVIAVSASWYTNHVSCSDTCTSYTVYELREGGDLSLEDVLKASPRVISNSSLAFSCVNFTIHEGVYQLTAGITVLGDSISIRGVEGEKVVLRIGQNETSEAGERMVVPGLQFHDNVYVEIVGLEIDGSSGRLTFVDIEKLVIKSSTFRNFDQGSMDMLNCLNIVIEDSFISDNGQDLVIASRNFQGGSGGLSIQYTSDFPFISQPLFSLRKVSFVHNNAITIRNPTSMFSEVVAGNDFTGRGGALFVLLQSTQAVSGSIVDCVFKDNRADLYGGAIYIAFNEEANTLVTISNTQFKNNSAFFAGGGLVFSYQVGGSDVLVNRVIMRDCIVENSGAIYAGGVYLFITVSSGQNDGVFTVFDNCTFVSNTALEYGAAFGVTALNFYDSKEETKPSEFRNCFFLNNRCPRGGALTYFPFLFMGRNTLENSIGPAIMIIGAKAHVSGELLIANTSVVGSDSGALYIISYGQLEVKRNTRLTFVRNRGNFGAAMVMSISSAPSVYSRTIYNPLCPLQFENSKTKPDEWESVEFVIEGNTAIVGSGVYTNYLSLCSWFSESEPFFSDRRAYRWDTFTYGKRNINSAHTSNVSSLVYVVQTPPVNTVVTNRRIEGFPGQIINVGVHGFSETGSLTSGVWRVTEDVTSDSVVMVIRNCPPGQQIQATAASDQSFSCACNEQRTQILECGFQNITLDDQLWATEASDLSDRLYMYACPPRHCRCYLEDSSLPSHCYNIFVEDSEDSLCTCDRKGILCGECKSINDSSIGVSVLLNNCVSCDDGHSVLIALLIFILILMFPFPSWIIPSIFYIQLIPLLTEHFPTTFEQVQPGIVYVSNAISFYFPYDFCLYHDMTTVVSYCLKFIPAILACIVIPVTVVFRNQIYQPTTLHGVWLIVLLLYTPTLHAVISVFNCPSVPITEIKSSDYEYRWFYNGSVTCFSDPGHGGLLLLGILGLLLCTGLVSAVFILTLDKVPGIREVFAKYISRIIKFAKTTFIHWHEALVYHYEDNNRWWPTMEPLKRTIMVVFAVWFPLNFFPVFFILSISLLLTGLVMPYKSRVANYLELTIGSIVSLLILIPQVNSIMDDLDVIVVLSSSAQNVTDEGIDMLSKCDIEFGISPLVALLIPFYYLPLVIILVVGIAHLGFNVHKRFSNRFSKNSDHESGSVIRRFSFKSDVQMQRKQVTFTDISLDTKEHESKL